MLPAWQALAVVLALPAYAAANSLNCKEITVNGQDYNLKELAGPKTVHWQRRNGIPIHNTTYTIDICNTLKYDDDLPKEEQCPHGTNICSSERIYDGSSDILQNVFPITGAFTHQGMAQDTYWERLQDGASNEDAEREGLRVTLHGGKDPFDGSSGKKQQAIIEFVCNKTLTGNEGFEKSKKMSLIQRDDGDQDDGASPPALPALDAGKSLQFVSYKEGEEVNTLRLTWQTSYACEGAPAKSPSKSGWGFFTWFVIIVFLLAASYIIFGSWLNYNRYGARGWDLVPHGDTIRDLPYILKDFFSSLIGRIRGEGGSRGGYSAV